MTQDPLLARVAPNGQPVTDLITKRPNVYGFGGLHRSAHLREREGWLDELLDRPDTILVPVWRSRSLIDDNGDGPRAGLLDAKAHHHLVDEAETVVFLGERNGTAYLALDLSELEEPHVLGGFSRDSAFLDLRQIGPLLERFEGSVLAYARGLMWWHQRHRFCGVCGSPTKIVKGGHQRVCTNEEQNAAVPRTTRGSCWCPATDAFWASKMWPEGMYSTLAGFVEPGETLKRLSREVWESGSRFGTCGTLLATWPFRPR